MTKICTLPSRTSRHVVSPQSLPSRQGKAPYDGQAGSTAWLGTVAAGSSRLRCWDREGESTDFIRSRLVFSEEAKQANSSLVWVRPLLLIVSINVGLSRVSFCLSLERGVIHLPAAWLRCALCTSSKHKLQSFKHSSTRKSVQQGQSHMHLGPETCVCASTVLRLNLPF